MQGKSVLRQIAIFGIMMIMLFVVLSTATYAWYSASNVASVDGLTFTSSAVDSEGGLLALGSAPTSTSTTMTFDQLTTAFSPMIPVNSATVGTTTYSAFIANFTKTSEGYNETLAAWVAKLDGTAATPTTLTCDDNPYFYVINRSGEGDFTVKIEYVFEEEESAYSIKDKIHIAFFIGEEANNANLLGIASLSDIHYGAIHAGEVVADTPVMSNVRKDTSEMTFSLPASEYAVLRAVVWLDGVDMKNDHGSREMLFSLTFRGE